MCASWLVGGPLAAGTELAPIYLHGGSWWEADSMLLSWGCPPAKRLRQWQRWRVPRGSAGPGKTTTTTLSSRAEVDRISKGCLYNLVPTHRGVPERETGRRAPVAGRTGSSDLGKVPWVQLPHWVGGALGAQGGKGSLFLVSPEVGGGKREVDVLVRWLAPEGAMSLCTEHRGENMVSFSHPESAQKYRSRVSKPQPLSLIHI